MSLNYLNEVNYSTPEISTSLPSEVVSGKIILPIGSELLSQQIITNTASLTNGGQMYIQIPATSNTVISPGSSYLRMDLTVNVSSPDGKQTSIAFNNPMCSASALLDRCTLTVGGQVVDTINNSGFVDNMIVLQKTSDNWVQSFGNTVSMYCNNSNAVSTSGANAWTSGSTMPYQADSVLVSATGAGGLANVSQIFHVIIPLNVSPLGAGSDQAFPLYLCENMTLLQLDFQSQVSKLFYAIDYTGGQAAGGPSVLSYTVSNCSFVYESINLSPQYCNMVKQGLAQGGSFLYHCTSVQSQLTAVSGAFSILYSLGLNSLCGISYTFLPSSFSVTSKNNFSDGGQQSYFYLYLDGKIVNSIGAMDTRKYGAVVFSEAKKCWSSWGDSIHPTAFGKFSGNPLILSGTGGPRDNSANSYLTKYFIGGQNTQVWRQGSGYGSGSVVKSNAKLEGQIANSANMLMVAIFNQVLEFKAGGIVSRLI